MGRQRPNGKIAGWFSFFHTGLFLGCYFISYYKIHITFDSLRQLFYSFLCLKRKFHDEATSYSHLADNLDFSS